MSAERAARLVFVAALVLAAFLLWPGLPGPFVVDDPRFLAPIGEALRGERSWASALLLGDAGPLRRPLSLASFGASAALCGYDASCLRAGNIVLHLAVAALVATLVVRVLRRDPALRAQAAVLGPLAAACWVVLPLHTSAVLYTTQRMTVLATAFAIAGLVAFLVARERIEARRGGVLALWIGVPAFTALASLSKEIGLLLPALCLVLEATLFRPAPGTSRPASVAWFFRVAVFAPALLVAYWLADDPARVLAGYGERPFTLGERVLTQTRVLWDYVAATFVPDAARVGVFNDDYVVSTGFDAATVAACVAWLAVAALAVAALRSFPAVAAGVGLFAAGHLFESTIFSLEIYFAHRNYLPSIGLLLAATALAGRAVAHRGATARVALAALAVAWVVPMAVTSAAIARAWSGKDALLQHELTLHPRSFRLRSEIVAHAIERRELQWALSVVAAADALAAPADRRAVGVWRIQAWCLTAGWVPDEPLAALADVHAERITPITAWALQQVVPHMEAGCAAQQRLPLAAILDRWLRATVQSPGAVPVWQTRLVRARLLASAGRLREAQRDALDAFGAGGDFGAGVLAFQVSASLDDTAACGALLPRLAARADPRDRRHAETLAAFERAFERALATGS